MPDTKIAGYLNGIVACYGDENLVFDYTEAVGSPFRIQRGGSEVMEVTNSGAINLDINSADSSFIVAQAGAGPVFTFIDGTIAAGDTRLVFTDKGALTQTPETQTASFTANTLTLTSGGVLGFDQLIGQQIDIVGHATDTGFVYGQVLDFTQNSGSAISIGSFIDDEWYLGIAAFSPVMISNDSVTTIPLGTLLFLSTNNADPLYDYFVQFNDANAGAERFTMNQLGVGAWDADATATALTIGQSGAGALLSLKDGTVLAGIERLQITQYGTHTLAISDDYLALDINCGVTDTAGDYSAVTLDIVHTTDITVNNKNIYGIQTTLTGRAGDAADAAVMHAAYRAEFTGTLPTDTDVSMYGFSADAGFLAGLQSESPLQVIVANRPTTLPVTAVIAYSGVASGMPTLYVVNGASIFAPDTVMQFTDYGQLIVVCDYDDKPVLKLQQLHATGHYIDVWDETNTLVFNLIDDGVMNLWATADGIASAAFYVKNTWAVNADSYIALFEDDVAQRFFVQNNGHTMIQTKDDVASEALNIDQKDEDAAFINFNGTEAADTTKNISTLPGDGTITGPLHANVGNGWSFAKMLKMEVNGDVYWIAAYEEESPV